MAMSFDEYNRLIAQMPKSDPAKGDEIELSEEDEKALDKAWEQAAQESKNKIASA